MSTSIGHSLGPTNTNIAVTDHRSVFIQIQTFDCLMGLICNSGASVSCISSEIFNSLKLKHSLNLELANTQVKAANQMFIETRGIVSVPVRLG